MQVNFIPIDSVIPYARNSRKHASDVPGLASGIVEFGFTNPVLLDGQGLVAGHGRLAAVKLLYGQGKTIRFPSGEAIPEGTIPAIDCSGWSPTQRKAYVIWDNRSAERSEWDIDALALELEDLRLEGYDIDLTGFDPEALEKLFGDAEMGDVGNDGLTDPDEVPEPPPEPITKPGDVWVLGSHRLMCGDSTKAEDVARLMAGERAQLIHADPPYGMGFESEGVENDNLYFEKLAEFQMQWWGAFRRHTKDNGSAYIWGWEDSLFDFYLRLRSDDSLRITKRNYIIWNKKSGQGINQESLRRFAQVTEHCLFFMLGEQGFNNNADNYWEGWEPIRSYLDGEMNKCGGNKQWKNALGNQMGGHYFTKSQWSFPTEEAYKKLQAFANGAAFLREYDELKREYDELKRDFYATRAYFDNTHDKMTDVWDYPRVKGDERHGHATPKPVDMIARCMMSSLPKGGLCAEPFSGSGTTIIAGEKTGRRVSAMELSPVYVDVAVKRWEDFTGQKAVKM